MVGEVRLQGGLYRAELRGRAQALTAPAVEVYTPECRADLGDHHCQVDIAALTVPGSVASAADRRTITTSDVTDPLPGASGLYNGGVLSWISGANAGLRMEVKSWDAGSRTLVLFLPMPYGTVRTGGNVIWSSGLKEVETRRSRRVGKGGQRQATVTYSYFASLAIAFGAGPAQALLRL